MKKIILSFAALICAGTLMVSAQSPKAKEAINVAVENVAKEKGYTAEQISQLKTIMLEKETASIAVSKQKLPKEQHTQEIKKVNGEYAVKINELLGEKGAHSEIYKAVIAEKRK